MTVAAIDPQAAHVMLMTERNRLILDDPLIGEIARAVQRRPHPPHERNDEDEPEDARLGEDVHRGMEDLRHGRRLC